MTLEFSFTLTGCHTKVTIYPYLKREQLDLYLLQEYWRCVKCKHIRQYAIVWQIVICKMQDLRALKYKMNKLLTQIKRISLVKSNL